ncbi:hypothetical protein [Methanotorris igneus]|uniref:Uncharacterized protein n=1 Tax=Methanotorris igneus (strain DSM 5666 / JCM 11834 / Kol 5) TaxID=880724 RepID=F6BDP6_METIK|nr:hypothetical protein [Methanotorris igneus]AEF96607.1 hypothetical protein Metig_1068 [Methanotorris igneus Kol 5]
MKDKTKLAIFLFLLPLLYFIIYFISKGYFYSILIGISTLALGISIYTESYKQCYKIFGKTFVNIIIILIYLTLLIAGIHFILVHTL